MSESMNDYLLRMLDAGELGQALHDCDELDHLPIPERLNRMRLRRYYRTNGLNPTATGLKVARIRSRNGC